MKKATATGPSIPDKFISIISDFANDLSNPFPEYEYLWSKWRVLDNIPSSMIQSVFYHCQEIYPERFFDILYQNEEIFQNENKVNTCFLPNVEFKMLFNSPGVSEKTKNAMWKYIQLILFTIVGNVKDKQDFGKSMNLFEGIDENELQEKLSEAMKNMTDFFAGMNKEKSTEQAEEEQADLPNGFEKAQEFFEKMGEFGEEFNKNDSGPGSIPPKFDFNPEDIHNHLKGLFDGKLGTLAKELMEELSDELKETFGTDGINANTQPKDLFKKLMKNPAKLMELVKKISSKFQDKMKKGDISQEEMMREATEMLRKMKEMGGDSKQMTEMFQNMAKSMGMGGKNVKVDTNAMNRMVKHQSIKDRLRAKLDEKKQQDFILKASSENQDHLIYQPLDGEKAEMSMIPPPAYDIDAIVAEIEAVGEKKPSQKKKNNKKKK
jgi:hypothetical protein